MSRTVTFACLEDVYFRPAIRKWQTIQAYLPLAYAHGSMAGSNRDKGLFRGVIKEGIYFVSTEGVRNQIGCLLQGRLYVCAFNGKQMLKCREQFALVVWPAIALGITDIFLAGM
jgi:hypothetical protein